MCYQHMITRTSIIGSRSMMYVSTSPIEKSGSTSYRMSSWEIFPQSTSMASSGSQLVQCLSIWEMLRISTKKRKWKRSKFPLIDLCSSSRSQTLFASAPATPAVRGIYVSFIGWEVFCWTSGTWQNGNGNLIVSVFLYQENFWRPCRKHFSFFFLHKKLKS